MESQATNASQLTTTALPKQTSADELLDYYDQEVQEKAAEIETEVQKQAKIAEEVPKQLVANKIVKNLKNKGEGKDESQVSSSSQSESQGQEEKEEVVEESLNAETKIPAFKAKFGEDEFDVPEEATIPTEVNGKPVQVKVRDAVKAFAAQEKISREINKRLSYVDQKEKEHKSQVESMQRNLKQVADAAAAGDHMGALKVLAELAGKDPVEYEKSVLETLHKINEVFSSMTPDQKEAYFAKRQAEYLKTRLEGEQKRAQWQKDTMSLHQQVLSLCKSNNLTEDQFKGYLGELVELGVDPKTISPEDVITHHNLVNHAIKVGAAIRLVDPKLADNEELVSDLIENTRDNLDYTEEEIAEIIQKVLSVDSKLVENLNRKVQKGNESGFRAQPKQTTSAAKKKDEQLDEDLYEEFLGKRPLSPRR